MDEKQEQLLIGRFPYQGNIDLFNRPRIENKDGSFSTVATIGVNVGGREVVIPTAIKGKVVSEKKAIQHFQKTGESFGEFDSIEDASEFAEELHRQQEQLFGNPEPLDREKLIQGITP